MKNPIFPLFALLCLIASCSPAHRPELDKEVVLEEAPTVETFVSAMPAGRDPAHEYRMLAAGSYTKIVSVMRHTAIIGGGGDINAWWCSYNDKNGYQHDLIVLQGEYHTLNPPDPTHILVHVSEQERPRETLFSYTLLPSDSIMFHAPDDTVHLGMIREAVWDEFFTPH